MLDEDYFIERQNAVISNPYAQAAALLGIRESSVPVMGIATLEQKGDRAFSVNTTLRQAAYARMLR